jgi:hypothetical protein
MAIFSSMESRCHRTDGEPWSPYWSDYMDHSKSVFYNTEYYENVTDRPNLVITYGDSWTWGDSLGADRLNQIYGQQLANLLDSDFAYSAYPGSFNYWTHNRLQVLLDYDIKRLSQTYKNVYVVVTLTELGRDFEFDQYVNEFLEYCTPSADADTILKQAEQFDFEKLASVDKQLPSNCHLIVGRNFTHTYADNANRLTNLVDESWADLLFKQQNFDIVPDIRIMSFGIRKFEQWATQQPIDQAQFKSWYLENVLIPAQKQIDLLVASKYNFKEATKHPTAEGHKIWALHLYNYIQSRLTFN